MSTLEKKLGLIETSAVDIVLQEPTATNLKKVPKAAQTHEMLMQVCAHDGCALKHASKKLITPKLCETAVKENGLALQFVPDRIIETAEKSWLVNIYKAAVSSNSQALHFVPVEFKNAELVEAALLGFCQESRDDYAIAYVPDNLRTKELIFKAVEHFPSYLRDLPTKKITKKLAEIAVTHDGLALRLVPRRHLNADLVRQAISQNAMAIRYVPQEYLTAEMCKDCFDRNCAVLPFLPAKFITKEMCLETIEKHRFFVFEMLDYRKEEIFGTTNVELVEFNDFPEKLRNDREILDAIIQMYEKYGSTPLLKWNERLEERLEKYPSLCTNKRNEQIKPLQKKTIAYLKKKAVATPREEEQSAKEKLLTAIMKSDLLGYAKKSALSPPEEYPETYQLVPYDRDTAIPYNLSQSDSAIQKVYYVSDIHIEHQFPEELKKIPISKKMDFTMEFLNRKVSELVSEVPESRDSILLIAGDVADNIYLTEIFYEILRQQWKGGTIISVLGNHELWETTSADEIVRRAVASALNPDFKHRAVEPIVEDYKKVINRGWWLHRGSIGHDRPTTCGLSNELYVNSVLLENELYICYQGRISRVLHEAEILDAPVEELTDLLSKCTFILLGGIGFSGLNPVYNATYGLYCDTITTIEEDMQRTDRFRRIYEKVESSAADRKVIVLTHTPVYDWTNARCNKNWIYVNGHTHQNILCLDEDTTVFADNQIGYKQQKWKLNSFTIDKCRYDPFSEYEDGIYEITSDQYKDFNRGRGILCNGCNYEGTLYMLKRNELYMFLLQSTKSLNLMAGGQRKKLDRKDIRYYYDNMILYSEMVRRKTEPYQKVLRSLSKEIKQIGGIGTIHGCIVDISFFSHLYVNPLDGKITPYWALNMMSRIPYDSFKAFLEKHEPELLHKYLLEKDRHSLPLLSTYTSANDRIPDSTLIPEWMYGTEIYQQSRIIKAIQYVLEQNVIRIWNDELLQENKLDTDSRMIEC